MINKILSIFKDERLLGSIIFLLLILYIISFFLHNSDLKYIIDSITKLIFVFWIIGFFELLKEIDDNKRDIIKDLKSVNTKITLLLNLSQNLNKELIKHIWLDLKRDQKFLDIMIQLEETLWTKVNINNYENCLNVEKEHLNSSINVLKLLEDKGITNFLKNKWNKKS